jgi:hypothetical protein
MSRSRARRHEAGQAAVETALTMPLTLFLILGTIQLFTMFQARLMAQYAVARATRMGSVSYGECQKMSQVAVAALLPTFARTDTPETFANEFERHKDGNFNHSLDGAENKSPIFWLDRLRPTQQQIRDDEEDIFDVPADQRQPGPRILEVRMTFWYPLRIPFANWMIARMALAQMQISQFQGLDELSPVRGQVTYDGTGRPRGSDRADEMERRIAARLYTVPIETTYAMRMMTPPRKRNFQSVRCP